MTTFDGGEYEGPPPTPYEFPVRLRGTGRWRRGLAADAREWRSADPALGHLDPVRQAAARFAAELDLTATVYELIHEGLPKEDAGHASGSCP